MDLPNLDDLIKAIECGCWSSSECEHCPWNYQYWDDRGDNGIWACDEDKLWKNALFYLKLYQYLIKINNKNLAGE